MGTYRSGQTWVEPAFANNIASENASMVEPARALVVLITNDTGFPERAPETDEFGNVPALSAAGAVPLRHSPTRRSGSSSFPP